MSNRNHSHEVTINGIYTIIELWFYKIIVVLQNQGFTIREISKELDIAVATVYGSIKQYGTEMI